MSSVRANAVTARSWEQYYWEQTLQVLPCVVHIELQNATETIRKLEDELKIIKQEVEIECRRKIKKKSVTKDMEYWMEKAKYTGNKKMTIEMMS